MVQRRSHFGPRSQRSLAVLHAFLVNVAGVPSVRKPAGDSATGEGRRARECRPHARRAEDVCVREGGGARKQRPIRDRASKRPNRTSGREFIDPLNGGGFFVRGGQGLIKAACSTEWTEPSHLPWPSQHLLTPLQHLNRDRAVTGAWKI